jgi:hypothetical protein
MPSTPAKFTQADLARAIRAAKAEGMTVRVLRDGTIEIVPVSGGDPDLRPEAPVAARREFRL